MVGAGGKKRPVHGEIGTGVHEGLVYCKSSQCHAWHEPPVCPPPWVVRFRAELIRSTWKEKPCKPAEDMINERLLSLIAQANLSASE